LQAHFSDAAWKVLAGAMIWRFPETSFHVWQASPAQGFCGGLFAGLFCVVGWFARDFDRVALRCWRRTEPDPI
jgi:hypothetical protein